MMILAEEKRLRAVRDVERAHERALAALNNPLRRISLQTDEVPHTRTYKAICSNAVGLKGVAVCMIRKRIQLCTPSLLQSNFGEKQWDCDEDGHSKNDGWSEYWIAEAGKRLGLFAHAWTSIENEILSTLLRDIMHSEGL